MQLQLLEARLPTSRLQYGRSRSTRSCFKTGPGGWRLLTFGEPCTYAERTQLLPASFQTVEALLDLTSHGSFTLLERQISFHGVRACMCLARYSSSFSVHVFRQLAKQTSQAAAKPKPQEPEHAQRWHAMIKAQPLKSLQIQVRLACSEELEPHP